jgi:hypothetical protein
MTSRDDWADFLEPDADPSGLDGALRALLDATREVLADEASWDTPPPSLRATILRNAAERSPFDAVLDDDDDDPDDDDGDADVSLDADGDLDLAFDELETAEDHDGEPTEHDDAPAIDDDFGQGAVTDDQATAEVETETHEPEIDSLDVSHDTFDPVAPYVDEPGLVPHAPDMPDMEDLDPDADDLDM